MEKDKQESYKQIAKSSGLIAFVSIFQMISGLVRNKFISVLLGAKGFGIYGMYQIFIETAISFGALGLDKSGVREIAKANSNNEIDKYVYIFRNTLYFTSIFVSIICAFFSKFISKNLFGSEDYYIGVLIACVAICFRVISQGQVSILNGIRDLRALAITQIIAAIGGSFLAIIFIYIYGEKAIPLSFLFFALFTLIVSSLKLRRYKFNKVEIDRTEYRLVRKRLLYLGLGFSISAIVAAIFTYFSRVYLIDTFSLEIVGIYQACWLISNMYIGIILSSMGVDFMPRLMKSIGDKSAVNIMINQQMEMGVLISGVAVVGLILFPELILRILYSSEFVQGADIIRWQVLGVFLRVIGFPFAHTVMAYNKPRLYAIIQIIFAALEFGLLVVFTKLYGEGGLGISYFIGYILFLLLWFISVRKISNFSFSKNLNKLVLINVTFFLIAFFLVFIFEKGILFYSLGILLIGIVLFVTSRLLKDIMGISLLSIISKKINKK